MKKSNETNSLAEAQALVRQLYEIVKRLEQLFPGRKFTLDGHLIGSLGEVHAVSLYDLRLLPNSSECHDAKSSDGKLVQIKTTQKASIAMSSEPHYLLALRLNDNGMITEIYNGPGAQPWQSAGRRQKNGQRRISSSKLKFLMSSVGIEGRISKRNT